MCQITPEQMVSLLNKPTKPSRKQELEATVQKRTPHYINLNNPQYDQELMEAHLKLATIYAAEGDVKQSHFNFKVAENEFLNMSRVKTQQPKYIMGGKEGAQRFMEQQAAIERQLDDYKTRLVSVASDIGYDALNLMFIQTNSNPKSTLIDLIKTA